jgi:outer membrane protein assembly factor BamB
VLRMGVTNSVRRARKTRLGAVLVAVVCIVACARAAAVLAGSRVAGGGLLAQATPAAELPQLTSTGVKVQALWQAPLVEAAVSGNFVVGLVAGQRALGGLEAISALTGQPVWTATVPLSRRERVLGMLASGGFVVVEIGHGVGYAGILVATREVVFDGASGSRLWSVSVVPGRFPHEQPIAYSQGLIAIADAAGRLTARNARTGAVAWRRARPRSCPQGTGYEGVNSGLTADGQLLVVSYHCLSHGRAFVVVRRLDPRTGAPLWQWRSTSVADTPESGIDLSVLQAAVQGDLVLLSGQTNARRYAKTLPRRRWWPTALGPSSDSDMLLALDARTGRPRWTEVGGQLVEVMLTDGLACETVPAGFECRDDRTGLPSRPLLRTTRSEGDSPPYRGDGHAGISGNVAGVVLAQAPTGAVSVAVLPLRGDGVVARATVQLGNTVYGGAKYGDFIVGAGQLPGGSTLLLLRRVDVAEYPLVALSVMP